MTVPGMRRRSLLEALSGGMLLSLTGAVARRPGIAITIDDFNLTDTALMTGAACDGAIRASLKAAGIKAAGFVAGKYITDDVSRRVLAAWSDDGHILGNHSFSHKILLRERS